MTHEPTSNFARPADLFSPKMARKITVVESGCWLFEGATTRGYAVKWFDGVRMGAHRWAYEHGVGPLDPALDVDHLCHGWDETCAGGPTCTHRRCVNPAHLDLVTRSVNVLRGRGIAAINARRKWCARGHELAGENLIIKANGARGCRECALAAQRNRYVPAVEHLPNNPAGQVYNGHKTHCYRGHPFDEENTLIRANGARVCRACQKINNEAKQQRKRERWAA